MHRIFSKVEGFSSKFNDVIIFKPIATQNIKYNLIFFGGDTQVKQKKKYFIYLNPTDYN